MGHEPLESPTPEAARPVVAELAAVLTEEPPPVSRRSRAPTSPDLRTELPPRHAPPSTTGQLRPTSRPPFLASNTTLRQMTPFEPWAERLAALMVILGAILMVTFVVPWEVPPAGDTSFAWDVIRRSPQVGGKLLPVFVVSLGLMLLLLGVLPVTTMARALATTAATAVVAALATSVLAHRQGIETWRLFAVLGGLLLLPPALLSRSRYPAALLPRLLATGAAVLVLLAYLIPWQGQVPVAALLSPPDELGDEIIARTMLVAPFFLALLAALVWTPQTVTRGASTHAWGALFWFPAAFVLLATAGAATGGDWNRILRTPGSTLIPALVWFSLAVLFAYGGAQLLGKLLENPHKHR